MKELFSGNHCRRQELNAVLSRAGLLLE